MDAPFATRAVAGPQERTSEKGSPLSEPEDSERSGRSSGENRPRWAMKPVGGRGRRAEGREPKNRGEERNSGIRETNAARD